MCDQESEHAHKKHGDGPEVEALFVLKQQPQVSYYRGLHAWTTTLGAAGSFGGYVKCNRSIPVSYKDLREQGEGLIPEQGQSFHCPVLEE